MKCKFIEECLVFGKIKRKERDYCSDENRECNLEKSYTRQWNFIIRYCGRNGK